LLKRTQGNLKRIERVKANLKKIPMVGAWKKPKCNGSIVKNEKKKSDKYVFS
jgi:hypothetical protein